MATLCPLCQKVVSTEKKKVLYYHHTSPQALYDSAQAGCRLCMELWDMLQYHEHFHGIENARGENLFGFSYSILDSEPIKFHFRLIPPNRKLDDREPSDILGNIVALPFDGMFLLGLHYSHLPCLLYCYSYIRHLFPRAFLK
jgi:hypothetical protein